MLTEFFSAIGSSNSLAMVTLAHPRISIFTTRLVEPSISRHIFPSNPTSLPPFTRTRSPKCRGHDSIVTCSSASLTIAVDFDGTIVEHKYPAIGRELPFAIETLKKLRDEHHRLILWTVREGRLLDEALAFCRDRGLEFYAVNRDYPEEEKGRNNHYSRKLKADLFIDDRNLGGLPDWGTIYGMIHDGTTFSDLIRNAGESPVSENHGRGLFSRLFGR